MYYKEYILFGYFPSLAIDDSRLVKSHHKVELLFGFCFHIS